MKLRLLSSLAASLLLASCGGGGQVTDGSKTSALSVCNPPSGPSGTKVTCAAKGIEKDSTLFFGKGNPVEYTLNAEEESVAFTAAGLAGKRLVFWQSESGVRPIGEFELTAAPTGGGDEVPAEPTVPAGDEGEVIAPSGTGGVGATGGEEAPPSDSDGDGVADAMDACPGTPSGTTVDSSGCPPPPPEPTDAEITKFTVTKVSDTGARLMTFKVEFGFARANEAYVWGNILNRTPADAALAPSDQCRIQGDRALRTGPLGEKLNPGTEPYLKLPVEGVLCDNANAGAADDCKSSSSSALLDAVPKDGSRFRDPLLKQDLYGLQYQIQKDLILDYAQPNKAIAVAPGIVFELAEKNPSCRLDLKKDGTLVTAGEFYTRSHAQHGNLCLAVRGEGDGWKVQCVTGDNLKATDVAVTKSSVSVNSGKMAVTLKVDYSPGTSAQVTGCTQNTAASTVQNNGLGHYEGECAIDALTKTIDATVFGVGEHNKKKKTYTIELGSPIVTLKPVGTVPLESETGNFKLEYKAVRGFTIKEGDSVLQSGEASWFKKTYFEGFSSGNGYKDASAPSEFFGERPVTQDADHNEWWFGVKDFDGHEEFKKYTSPGFPKTFSLSQQSGGGGMHIAGTETFPPAGICSSGIPIRIYHFFDWEGKNVKSISIEGGPAIDTAHSSKMPADKTGPQSGYLKIYKDVAHSGSWSESLNFTLVVNYQGSGQWKLPRNITGWSCN
jgi:hypothetical protein